MREVESAFWVGPVFLYRLVGKEEAAWGHWKASVREEPRTISLARAFCGKRVEAGESSEVKMTPK